MTNKIPTKKDFSCGGVVWDPSKKKVLLVRVENLSGAKVWTFPKGHPEPGETDAQAALREVREETGWACEVTGELKDVKYFYIHDRVRYHKTVRWFLMKPVERVGEPMPGEIIESDWATLAEAGKLISYGSDKNLLEDLKQGI